MKVKIEIWNQTRHQQIRTRQNAQIKEKSSWINASRRASLVEDDPSDPAKAILMSDPWSGRQALIDSDIRRHRSRMMNRPWISIVSLLTTYTARLCCLRMSASLTTLARWWTDKRLWCRSEEELSKPLSRNCLYWFFKVILTLLSILIMETPTDAA